MNLPQLSTTGSVDEKGRLYLPRPIRALWSFERGEALFVGNRWRVGGIGILLGKARAFVSLRYDAELESMMELVTILRIDAQWRIRPFWVFLERAGLKPFDQVVFFATPMGVEVWARHSWDELTNNIRVMRLQKRRASGYDHVVERKEIYLKPADARIDLVRSIQKEGAPNPRFLVETMRSCWMVTAPVAMRAFLRRRWWHEIEGFSVSESGCRPLPEKFRITEHGEKITLSYGLSDLPHDRPFIKGVPVRVLRTWQSVCEFSRVKADVYVMSGKKGIW